jgi:hypothetical protein
LSTATEAKLSELAAELIDLANTIHRTPSPSPAEVWAAAYAQGVEDERLSEAHIGDFGPGIKIQPNRNNPYTNEGTI